MGLLDILQGNGGASPWSALYPSPLLPTDQNAAAQAAAAYGMLGVDPSTLPGATPAAAQSNPFGDPSNLSVANPSAPPPAPTGFGAGATPFSFAGPGSNVVAPSQVATQAPVPMPQPRPAAADGPPTDVSSVNRRAVPPAAINAAVNVPASAPVNAAPSAPAASLPTSSPAPFSLGGAASGVGDRLALGAKGFLGNLANGPIGALLGGVGALVSGKPTDAGTIAAQKQNMTAQALLNKGVPLADVQAAVNDPEIMKTLVTQYFGPDKFQHVSRKNEFGGEEIGAFDPTTGKTTWGGSNGTPAAGGGVQGMVDGINQARSAGASRADLIKQIPAQYQGYISALLDGKATPANVGRGQERGALMTLAHAVDPTFDETMIPARIATATDFTPKGKSGASIVAFNTVQHHIGKLSDDFETLGNVGQGGFQAINSLRNGLATQTPFDPARQKAVQAVNDDLKAVSDEMSAAYKAGHVSDTEIKSWNSLVNSNLPLNQARQAISDFVDLLNGKRDALNKVHQQIMGGDAAIIDKDENSLITQKVHARNGGTAAPGSPSAAPALPAGWSVKVN